jgi:cyclomaltodextrin glucanotransferase
MIQSPLKAIAKLDMSDEEVRGETIYFVVLDRFNVGTKGNVGKDSSLNDATHQDWHKYWGGDIQGLINKLDYLSDLGITAVWVTPLFEQVEADSAGSSPIHGYWTQDFKRINSRWVNSPDEVRLFSKETIFDTLIAELHKRKMKFILDIVCNHSSPATSAGKGKLYDDGKLIADFDNDKDGWYHHYGDVKDWNDQWQVQNCELCGLATFNENNLSYRRYITSAIKMWLDKGVDALRIDTVKHMPLWFWQEFNCEIHRHNPNVFIFGEWIHNHPSDPVSVEFANHAGMSVFDFGLCQAIRACLGQDAPTGFGLIQDIYDQDHQYRGATEMITIFENHDMPRLQSLGASNEMFDLATCLLMTGRGVPCLYYGAEQYLHNDTDGGSDPYNRPMMEKWDTTTNAYHIVKKLSAERSKNKAIQWGGLWPKIVEKDLYVFIRKYRDSRCMVILNKGAERTIDAIDTELQNGVHTCLLTGDTLEVKEGQATQVKIGACQAKVFSFVGKRVEGKTIARIQLNGAFTQPGDKVAIIGDCPELGEWDLSKAIVLEYVNLNLWFTEIAFNESAGQTIAYKYVFLHPQPNSAPGRENRTGRLRAIPMEGVSKWRDVWEE